MTISTRSSFYYGHVVDTSNRYLDFNEGLDALVATLNPGGYSLTSYAVELARALNAAGALTYAVSVDRATRFITIAAGSNFSLLCNSGANNGQSVWSMAGFATSADLTGADSYAGTLASGSSFRPQYWLQKYTPFVNMKKRIDASVRQSSDGTVEVVTFGDVSFMECDILFSSDLTGADTFPVEANASGVSDLRSFLDAITLKNPMEFIPDRDTPATFTKCILESTAESKQGTDYKVKEMAPSFMGYFTSGKLVFREVS